MTPDEVVHAARIVETIAKRRDGFTLSEDARRAMERTADDLHWLLRQADFRSTLEPTDSTYKRVGGLHHQHILQGLVLTHDHADGNVPHGYFGHPEDPT